MAIDDARIVLIAIFTQLADLDAEVVGKVGLGYESISALDDKLTLTVDVQHDPSWHPSIAHCHVFAHLGSDRQVSLEACVVGLAASRNAGLLECAQTWIEMVAGPLFSLLHAKPVLGAVHFAGAEHGGFAGGHGFLGPIGARMFPSVPNADALERIASFEYAAEISPPELVHLAKVVMQATEHSWRRTLEIDGHRAVFADRPRIDGVPTPSQGVITRFAVYSFADRMDELEARRQIDSAIYKFVELFEKKGDSNAAAMALLNDGIDIEMARRVYALAPLAFGRVMFESIGIEFSPHYTTIDSHGACGDHLQLMSERIFARSTVIGAELLQSARSHAVQQLALTSAETHALNAALNAGLPPSDINGEAPIVSFQTARVLPKVEVSFSRKSTPSLCSRPDSAPITKKPWWQFWR